MIPDIENNIRSITDQLVQKYQAESVILFGSAAKNEWRQEDSDLDFLIVKTGVPKRGIDRLLELENTIERRIACDFLIYTPQELQERIRLGDPFVAMILKEGKVLHAKS
ncbi:MAG: nucleotidyltransferase domain-containing protein [Elusimicrobia bacterium]|nr:nucleotidyltransferase domain-containing protein [Elusimicrobiota bacterium]